MDFANRSHSWQRTRNRNLDLMMLHISFSFWSRIRLCIECEPFFLQLYSQSYLDTCNSWQPRKIPEQPIESSQLSGATSEWNMAWARFKRIHSPVFYIFLGSSVSPHLVRARVGHFTRSSYPTFSQTFLLYPSFVFIFPWKKSSILPRARVRAYISIEEIR